MKSKLSQSSKTAMNTSTLLNTKKRPQRIYKFATIVTILIIAVTIGSRLFSTSTRFSNSQTLGKTSQLINLDHSFQIPIETADGEQSNNKVTFTLISAELTDEIILKGQKATAVNDRLFLILNVKLSNPSESGIKLDTRNYIRLSVNGSNDRLAPNVHNDPIEIQPISDQPTRLGFSIEQTDTNHTLYVGEIRGDKIEIPLNFE